MPTLYYSPGACSLAPHIALREAGLDFSLERVDLKTKRTKNGADLTQVNPKGQVPTLRLDDGTILTEVPAVLQYLADLRPESGLAPPAESFERYRLQEWLNFVTSELHKGFAPLFQADTPPEYVEIVRRRLGERLAYLEQQLADGRQYLLGDRFTVADAYAFTVVSWSRYVKLDLAPWPRLQAYLGRVGARAKVQEALRNEGLAK